MGKKSKRFNKQVFKEAKLAPRPPAAPTGPGITPDQIDSLQKSLAEMHLRNQNQNVNGSDGAGTSASSGTPSTSGSGTPQAGSRWTCVDSKNTTMAMLPTPMGSNQWQCTVYSNDPDIINGVADNDAPSTSGPKSKAKGQVVAPATLNVNGDTFEEEFKRYAAIAAHIRNEFRLDMPNKEIVRMFSEICDKPFAKSEDFSFNNMESRVNMDDFESAHSFGQRPWTEGKCV